MPVTTSRISAARPSGQGVPPQQIQRVPNLLNPPRRKSDHTTDQTRRRKSHLATDQTRTTAPSVRAAGSNRPVSGVDKPAMEPSDRLFSIPGHRCRTDGCRHSLLFLLARGCTGAAYRSRYTSDARSMRRGKMNPQPGTGKYERLLERCKGLAPIPTAVAHPCEASALSGAVEAAERKI